jgi:hypothetical protein
LPLEGNTENTTPSVAMAINEHRRFVLEKDDPQLKILLQKLQNCNEPLYKDVLLDIQNLHGRTYREIVSVLPCERS